MKITLICGSYGRPARTERLLKNVVAQDCDKNNFEFLLIGDGCPVVQSLIDEDKYAYPFIRKINLPLHLGHPGECVNTAIEKAQGEFICFVGNDDVIKSNHISEKIKYINENPSIDLFIYNTIIKVPGHVGVRETELRYGKIGHSEIVVRTKIAQSVQSHSGDYGHDWVFIENLRSVITEQNIMFIKNSLTYEVRHMPGRGTFDKED